MTGGPAAGISGAGDPASDAVRGEAARLSRRLEVARGRLSTAASAARPPTQAHALPADTRVVRSASAESACVCGGGEVDDDEETTPPQRIDGAADEIRALLGPAQARLERLAELSRGLADGTLADDEAAATASALAEAHPSRRPR